MDTRWLQDGQTNRISLDSRENNVANEITTGDIVWDYTSLHSVLRYS